MTGFSLGARSRERLRGVHPDLVKVVERAIEITPIDFTVTEGRRTLLRQSELVQAKASRTMRSRHITGHAVDIAPLVGGEVRWDWPLFHRIAPAMKRAAKELNIPIKWGGDWVTCPDGPHFELDATFYPASP